MHKQILKVSFSLLLQSVFEGRRLSFSELCLLIWCYFKKLRSEEASSVIGISKKTTVKWFRGLYLKDAYQNFYQKNIGIFRIKSKIDEKSGKTNIKENIF